MACSKEVEATPPSGSGSNPAISHLENLVSGNEVEIGHFLIGLLVTGDVAEKYCVYTMIPASMDFNEFQVHVEEALELSRSNYSFILDWDVDTKSFSLANPADWDAAELRSLGVGDWNAFQKAAKQGKIIAIQKGTMVSSMPVRVTVVHHPQQHQDRLKGST